MGKIELVGLGPHGVCKNRLNFGRLGMLSKMRIRCGIFMEYVDGVRE